MSTPWWESRPLWSEDWCTESKDRRRTFFAYLEPEYARRVVLESGLFLVRITRAGSELDPHAAFPAGGDEQRISDVEA
jgi:hypothetical protein